MSAAWPRYITLSGCSIATRHLIKEYRRAERKGRTRTGKKQKQQQQQQGKRTTGIRRGNNKEMRRREEPQTKRKDGGHLRMRDDAPAASCREHVRTELPFIIKSVMSSC
ncbi:uncharacterized protein V6R79_020273 [Siganus canaliculatus]